MSQFPTYYKDCIYGISKDSCFRQPFNIQNHLCNTGPCQICDHSSVFLETFVKHAIVIDCAQFQFCYSFKKKPLLTCLRDQYRNASGIQFKCTSDATTKYVIIGFNTESECNQALKEQFTLQGMNIHVSKNLTYDESSHIVYVDISKIPIPCTDEVQRRLIEIFSEYGKIRTIGKYISKNGLWFSGLGYVILDANDDPTKYKELEVGDVVCGPAGLQLSVKTITAVKTSCSICLNEYLDDITSNKSSSHRPFPECPHYSTETTL